MAWVWRVSSPYSSGPYGLTPNGVRVKRMGYVVDESFGARTDVKSRTPSRIGMRYSYLVYRSRIWSAESVTAPAIVPASGVDGTHHQALGGTEIAPMARVEAKASDRPVGARRDTRTSSRRRWS